MSRRSKREVAPPPPPAVPSSPASVDWSAAPLSGSSGSGWFAAPPASMQAKWGMHPLGGFLSFLSNLAEWGPPQFVDSHGAKGGRPVSISKSGLRSQPLINLDSGEDDGDGARTDRRLQWMKEKEMRLVSAWLNNSNDPINGNCKKTDRYWGDVIDEYNSTTPKKQEKNIKAIEGPLSKN